MCDARLQRRPGKSANHVQPEIEERKDEQARASDDGVGHNREFKRRERLRAQVSNVTCAREEVGAQRTEPHLKR